MASLQCVPHLYLLYYYLCYSYIRYLQSGNNNNTKISFSFMVVQQSVYNNICSRNIKHKNRSLGALNSRQLLRYVIPRPDAATQNRINIIYIYIYFGLLRFKVGMVGGSPSSTMAITWYIQTQKWCGELCGLAKHRRQRVVANFRINCL